MGVSSGIRGRDAVCAPFHQHPGENLGQGLARYMWTCAPREEENLPFYTLFPSGEQRQEYLVEVQQLKLRSPRAMGCQEMSVANTCQPCGNLGLWAAFPDERSRQQKPRVQLIVWQPRETFWVTHQTSLFVSPRLKVWKHLNKRIRNNRYWFQPFPWKCILSLLLCLST